MELRCPVFSKQQAQGLHRLAKLSKGEKREFGMNIFGSLDDPRFGEITKGLEKGVMIPSNEKAIGTFHTHKEHLPILSAIDLYSAVYKNERVVCVGGHGESSGESMVRCYVQNTDLHSEAMSKYWDSTGRISKSMQKWMGDRINRGLTDLSDEDYRAKILEFMNDEAHFLYKDYLRVYEKMCDYDEEGNLTTW